MGTYKSALEAYERERCDQIGHIKASKVCIEV